MEYFPITKWPCVNLCINMDANQVTKICVDKKFHLYKTNQNYKIPMNGHSANI